MKVTEASLKDKAAGWAEKFAAGGAQYEAERRLSADVAAALAKDGYFRMLVPEAYGGLEAHPLTLVEILKQMAIGDASAAWNVMIGCTTAVLSATLPEATARHIYADNPEVMTVGVTAPFGKAEVVDGGYLATGRWPFGSGCQNAQWVCGGCFMSANGERLTDDAGQPQIKLLMFEAEQLEIEDTWDVLGLRGTGSHHYKVDQAFVPEDYIVTLGQRSQIQRPLYQFPTLGLLALGIAAVALGVGHNALQSFIRLATEKKPTGSGKSLAERAQVQVAVAKSVAELRSAEAFIKDAIGNAWEVALAGERLSVEQKADIRLAATNATHNAKHNVDRLYELGGGSSLYSGSPMHKCFRDIHAITQHLMVAQTMYEVTGRVYLGLPPKSPL